MLLSTRKLIVENGPPVVTVGVKIKPDWSVAGAKPAGAAAGVGATGGAGGGAAGAVDVAFRSRAGGGKADPVSAMANWIGWPAPLTTSTA